MTKKPPRRSIVANFGALTAEPSAGAAPEQKSGSSMTIGVIPARVAAGVIGATQRTLTDIREERDRLKAELAAGGAIAELEPELVDPSPFRDRLPDDGPAAFEAFKATVAAEGQKVPVEVRRHPFAPGRYQLVYGHRRWRAARELGLQLRAIIVDLDDQALAVAQGIENAARQDLSWIEKALFAARMEEAGIRAREIRAALSVDDPELARFRSVCRVIGFHLIETIGRAPRVGRPRWLELSAKLEADKSLVLRLSKTLAAAKIAASDDRFALCMEAAIPASSLKTQRVVLLGSPGDKPFGKAFFSDRVFRLTLEKAEASEFLAFLEDELPVLADRFLKQRGSR